MVKAGTPIVAIMISDNYSDLIGFFMLGKSLKVTTYHPVCFFQVRDNKS
jgi:hypothetical protein